MLKKCMQKGCQHSTEQNDFCILHCDKNDKEYEREATASKRFVKVMIDEILTKVTEEKQKKRLSHFFHSGMKKASLDQSDLVFFQSIEFTRLNFPKISNFNQVNYHAIFAVFDEITFLGCIFNHQMQQLSPYLSNTKFVDCQFRQALIIDEINSTSEHLDVVYRDCTFAQNVNLQLAAKESNKTNLTLFQNCQFLRTLSLSGDINYPIFDNSYHLKKDKDNFNFGKVHTLHVSNAHIKSKFILNRVKVEHISLENSSFEEEFELKDCAIGELELKDIRMQKTAEFFNSHAELFKCQKCKFYDFVSFEKFTVNKHTAFNYVTFLTFSTFRKAQFKGGLNLEQSNFKEPSNFLNTYICTNNTNRETYRIIKHAFNKVGNVIEEEKYAVLEMRRYRKELKAQGRGFGQENIILFFNQKISNFGSSWKRSAFWLAASITIFTLIEVGDEVNFLSQHSARAVTILGYFDSWVLGTFPFFARFLPKGLEFIGLFYYFFFSLFLWQFISSVKRYSKMK